jgi:hypothetical protein
VPERSLESSGPALRGAVEGAKTTFVTDGHKGYLPPQSQAVDHEAHVQATPERAGEIPPWVHVVISNLKSWLRGTFRGVSHKHLPSYLLELTHRLNRRGIEDRLFFYLTRRAVQGDPLPYSRLTAEAIG